jgi:hypothetical protein
MSTKIHINLAQGVLDAEGEEEFVWKVYQDFRDRLQTATQTASEAVDDADVQSGDALEEIAPEESKSRYKSKARKTNAKQARTNGSGGGMTGHKEKLVDYDTSGLKDFVGEYKLSSHYDKIVALVAFINTKGEQQATVDQIFTCYKDASLRLPDRFPQAFIDTKNKKGYIDFSGPLDIRLTNRGANYLTDLKKKEAAE